MMGIMKDLPSTIPLPLPLPKPVSIPLPQLPLPHLSLPQLLLPFLPRNFLATLFVHADRILSYLSKNFNFLHLLRSFITSLFLFLLSLIPHFFSAFAPSHIHHSPNYPSLTDHHYSSPIFAGGAVSRALYQLLLIMSDIPVSSRKYEVVRSLADKIIDENLSHGNQTLKDVNCAVLSAAFSRSLGHLESALADQGGWGGGDTVAGPGPGVPEGESLIYDLANLVLKGVAYFGRAAWRLAVMTDDRSGTSAEKLAAEVLWLAQKMAASGCAEEGVRKWASASTLAVLSVSAEPRVQGSIVKTSTFLIKEAKELGKDGEQDGSVRKWKVKVLITWLPLLCRANNGTDAPVLSMGERLEVERTLEEIIQGLEAEEQELVLSHWLHHFTYSPASDWPNLRASYTRWYNASRNKLLTAAPSPEED